MLADPTRIQVLWALADAELSVNELAERVGKPAPSVSQHLAKLRSAGLVKVRKDGATSYYTQPDEHLAQLVTSALQLSEHALYAVPPHHRPKSS